MSGSVGRRRSLSHEIRKEKDWWGDEKEVIYEDGHKVGETRNQETLAGFGPTVKRTYDNDGKRLIETRREETLGGFGPTVERTCDTKGRRISETRREQTLGGFGPTVKREYPAKRPAVPSRESAAGTSAANRVHRRSVEAGAYGGAASSICLPAPLSVLPI